MPILEIGECPEGATSITTTIRNKETCDQSKTCSSETCPYNKNKEGKKK